MSQEMVVRLGEVCKVVSGSTPKSSVSEYWDGDIKWITPAEIGDETRVINDTARHLTTAGVKATGLRPLPEGTVLLSSRAPIGKTAIAGCEMYCNQGFKNLICSERIVNWYLYYFLSSKTDYLNSLGRGATFKEISKGIVENIEIPLPSIDEQIRIAGEFDSVFSAINIEKRRLALFDELKKARFVEVFIDAGHPSIEVGNLLIQNTIVERINNTRSEKYITVGLHGAGARQRVIRNGKWPVPFSGYRVKAGQFVYSRIDARNGAFAILADELNNAVVSKDFPVFEIDASQILPSVFLSSVLEDRFIRQVQNSSFGATNRQRIKEDVFKKYTIPLAPLGVQREYEAFVYQVDQSVVAVRKSINELELLKASLTQEYFG